MESVDVENLASSISGDYPLLTSKMTGYYRGLHDKLKKYWGWRIPKDEFDFIPKVGLMVMWEISLNELAVLTHVEDDGDYYKIYIHNWKGDLNEYLSNILEDNF